jgi:hypothetical protein
MTLKWNQTAPIRVILGQILFLDEWTNIRNPYSITIDISTPGLACQVAVAWDVSFSEAF